MSQPHNEPITRFHEDTRTEHFSKGPLHIAFITLLIWTAGHCSPSTGWRDVTTIRTASPDSGTEGPFLSTWLPVTAPTLIQNMHGFGGQLSSPGISWLLSHSSNDANKNSSSLLLYCTRHPSPSLPAEAQNWNTSYPAGSTELPSTACPAIPISLTGHQRHQMKQPGPGHRAGVWWVRS